MIQNTSLLAYFEIQASLGAKQRLILDLFLKHGPMTNKMVAKKSNLPINSVTPRVKELRELEYIEYSDTIIQLNGRKAILWQVTKKTQG